MHIAQMTGPQNLNNKDKGYTLVVVSDAQQEDYRTCCEE